MPAFAETYSADQRAALFSAVLDNGMSVRGALDAAKTGQLEHLEPAAQVHLASMAYGYACQLVRDERADRGGVNRATGKPDAIARDIAARLLRRARQDTERITSGPRKTPMNAGQAAAVVKVTRDVMALLRDLDAPAKTTSPRAAAAAPVTAEPKTLAQRIAAQADSAADNASPTERDSGDNAPTSTSERDGQTEGWSGGAVRSSSPVAAPALGLERAPAPAAAHVA